MKNVNEYFRDYDAFHQTRGNKICHIIGISMIVVSLLGLLHRVVVFEVGGMSMTAALLLLILGNLFYLKLHVKLGMSMVISTAIAYAIGMVLPLSVLWTVFVLGWIAQFIGHYKYEHKSPAFAQNLIHLMIGPAYIQNYFLKILRL